MRYIGKSTIDHLVDGNFSNEFRKAVLKAWANHATYQLCNWGVIRASIKAQGLDPDTRQPLSVLTQDAIGEEKTQQDKRLSPHGDRATTTQMMEAYATLLHYCASMIQQLDFNPQYDTLLKTTEMYDRVMMSPGELRLDRKMLAREVDESGITDPEVILLQYETSAKRRHENFVRHRTEALEDVASIDYLLTADGSPDDIEALNVLGAVRHYGLYVLACEKVLAPGRKAEGKVTGGGIIAVQQRNRYLEPGWKVLVDEVKRFMADGDEFTKANTQAIEAGLEFARMPALSEQAETRWLELMIKADSKPEQSAETTGSVVDRVLALKKEREATAQATAVAKSIDSTTAHADGIGGMIQQAVAAQIQQMIATEVQKAIAGAFGQKVA